MMRAGQHLGPGKCKVSDLEFGSADVVHVDDKDFVNCTFNGTLLIYEGSRYVNMLGCTFNSPRIQFEGPAAHTFRFLCMFGAIPGANAWLDVLFEQMRAWGHVLQQPAEMH